VGLFVFFAAADGKRRFNSRLEQEGKAYEAFAGLGRQGYGHSAMWQICTSLPLARSAALPGLAVPFDSLPSID